MDGAKIERVTDGGETVLDRNALLLYLCADPSFCAGRTMIEVVKAAIRGGVSMVQLREKNVSSRQFYEEALRARDLTKCLGVPLVINDRADIAAAVGADGLHIGQSDIPLKAARRVVGRGMFIGVSARTVEAAVEAAKGGADYLGSGPVFRTDSKAGLGGAIGAERLREISSAVDIPVIVIGGIGPDNASEALRAGASGVAVISSILSRPDAEAAARELRRSLEDASRDRNGV